MGEKLLTESEERRIDEIYDDLAELWRNFHAKLYYWDSDSMCIVQMLLAFIVPAIVGTIIGGHVLFGLIMGTVGIIIIMPINFVICGIKQDKALQEIGMPEEAVICDLDSLKIVANLTKLYLKYLPMKSKIDENEFNKFLRHPCRPPDPKFKYAVEGLQDIYLRENDKQELIKIFREVKKRAENMGIANEYKMTLTPLEFFRNYFFQWWQIELETPTDEHSTKEWSRKRKVYKELKTYFKEFDEAPRISGVLVVELEDLLEENRIPVNKAEVMKFIEAWRKYKLEERLYIEKINL
ncbi:MAG: hypothetical protein WA977_08290 [Halobacteriota archaeon]